MAQNKYFAGLILGLKPGFDDNVFLIWKKEHVEMCIGSFVFQQYGKAHYMVTEFSVICLVVFA